MKINKIKFKTESLKDYAILLLQNKFRVFVYDSNEVNNKVSWLIIEKDNNIGYVQLNDFSGFSFSTKHKPNMLTGTGYGILSEGSPTIENALKTFVNYPDWARPKDKLSVIKYKDIDEYLKSSTSLKYVEVTL